MRRVDVKTYEELLNDLIAWEQKPVTNYEQPFLQIPVPEAPVSKQEAKEEEPRRVIIIDI